MYRALLKPASTVALLAAAGLSLSIPSASAADLGGDCCADLEERVAELEATTARKGNRKVSLEVSGQVNEAIMFWDDGDESNAYVVTNDTSRSRFRFKGKAKITDDVEAGYLIEIGVRSARSDRVDQRNDDGVDNGLDIRHSYWYLKSKTYGELAVGQTAMATESITEINLANTGDVAKNSDVEDYFAGFQLRRKGVAGDAGLSNQEWRRLMKDDATQPGESNRRNIVRYTTPAFQGFTASASWGEDDNWDAALRYAGEFNGIKISAGIGYGENTERDIGEDPQPLCIVNSTALPNGDAECNQFGGSISVMHVPSGIFVAVGAGRFTDENIDNADFNGDVGGVQILAGADDESDFYSVQAGIEQKWLPLGKTTLFGEYFSFDGAANDQPISNADVISPFLGLGGNSHIIDSEIEVVGGGVVQAIDAAAMSVYIAYRHFEGDATFRRDVNGASADAQIEDLDVVMSGAVIKF